MRPTPFVLAATALALSGCLMIPKYTRPDPPVPPSWPETATAGGGAETAPLATTVGWQVYFADAQLRSVIELALANNRDLRIAALNIEKAQAVYRIQRGALSPDIGVMASGQMYRVPKTMPELGDPGTFREYTVEAGVSSWELDLFGRLRSLKAAALEQYLATEQARSATQIAIVGAVASGYLALAADEEHLALSRSILEAQTSSAALIQRSNELGVASDLDLREAQSQVDAARAGVATYLGAVATDRNALDALVGAPVPADLLPGGWSAVKGMPALSPGVPSEVLVRRPDIVAAEHQLKAANANIGAARATFFPRITLTGGGGSMSDELSKLLGTGSGTWTFTPQLIAPLFAGGSLKANLKAARVDREIAVAQYEKAIQQAFAEVGDALALRRTLVDAREAEELLVDHLGDAYRLSDARYQAGIDSYLAVLVSQRSLLAARHGLVDMRLAEQANLVRLYKVLGGGA
ncbi:MAG TPA: efflux transporter outer membrane subunit [Thermoanaerobaculaceae bacterium]|nr:efflux transporter outer membrane subunit [Thermoanaerobaculaceae bacterium]